MGRRDEGLEVEGLRQGHRLGGELKPALYVLPALVLVRCVDDTLPQGFQMATGGAVYHVLPEGL